MFLRLIKICKIVAQLLDKGYKVSFKDKLCVIKDANNLEVFKIHTKDNNSGSR